MCARNLLKEFPQKIWWERSLDSLIIKLRRTNWRCHEGKQGSSRLADASSKCSQTEVVFVKPAVKITGTYCQGVLLWNQSLPNVVETVFI